MLVVNKLYSKLFGLVSPAPMTATLMSLLLPAMVELGCGLSYRSELVSVVTVVERVAFKLEFNVRKNIKRINVE